MDPPAPLRALASCRAGAKDIRNLRTLLSCLNPDLDASGMARQNMLQYKWKVPTMTRFRVEPWLYRTIVWSRSPTSDHIPALPIARGVSFLNTVESKPVSFLHGTTRNLMLGGRNERKRTEFLAACRGVENLWLGAASTLHGIFAQVQDLPLRRLYCNIRYLFGGPLRIDFTHRLFAQITHLEIFDAVRLGPRMQAIWQQIPLIPHLSHLSFHREGFIPVCAAALRSCPSLRVLVVFQSHAAFLIDRHNDRERFETDPRFVMMDCALRVLDWQVGALMGLDYWSRAEDWVAKRISGEVDALQYRIEPDESTEIEGVYNTYNTSI
ncbi:hypothetical protein DFH06DRAFT_161053 [Mycena polygramma]|nr:hypothetical protein DFH06DRAFT_161053 [Mycena polygramma]